MSSSEVLTVFCGGVGLPSVHLGVSRALGLWTGLSGVLAPSDLPSPRLLQPKRAD